MDCFSLFYHQEDWIGVGRTEGSFLALYQKGFVAEWLPPTFLVPDGAIVDYQPNNVGWHLCSETMRYSIEKRLTGNENIQWLPAFVIGAEDQHPIPYFILHAFRPVNVLNMSKSLFAGDHLMKPVLSHSKIAALQAAVFAIPFDSVHLYVTAAMKGHLSNVNITGIKFLKAAMSE